MSLFVRTTQPTRPDNYIVFAASLLAAGMLTIVAIAQLFTFEDLPAVLAGYALPGGDPSSSLLAAFIVTAEVLAVPCLLMVRLSPLMRLMSVACGWLSCLVWLVLGWQFVAQGDTVMNSGLWGATVATPVGWLPLLFAGSLAVLLAIAGPVPLHRSFWRRNYRLRLSRATR